MISAVSDATQTQPVAPSTASSSQKPAQSQPQSATTDSVQLSAAAQAALAAIQEARETQAQTSKEAAGGDLLELPNERLVRSNRRVAGYTSG